jgi:hypothetical protein
LSVNQDDQPTIGIILCRSKNRAIAEYALRGIQKPISVATHQMGGLPSALASELPTIEQLETEMNIVVSQSIHNSELP